MLRILSTFTFLFFTFSYSYAQTTTERLCHWLKSNQVVNNHGNVSTSVFQNVFSGKNERRTASLTINGTCVGAQPVLNLTYSERSFDGTSHGTGPGCYRYSDTDGRRTVKINLLTNEIYYEGASDNRSQQICNGREQYYEDGGGINKIAKAALKNYRLIIDSNDQNAIILLFDGTGDITEASYSLESNGAKRRGPHKQSLLDFTAELKMNLMSKTGSMDSTRAKNGIFEMSFYSQP